MRFDDWAERMHEELDTARARPFKWGGHDCCLFACDLVMAMTGVDPARSLRRRYHDKHGAALALREAGYDGLEHAVESLAMEHDFVEILPLTAQRGDLALVDQAGGPALGVVIGEDVALATDVGWLRVPVAHKRVRRAWGVG